MINKIIDTYLLPSDHELTTYLTLFHFLPNIGLCLKFTDDDIYDSAFRHWNIVILVLLAINFYIYFVTKKDSTKARLFVGYLSVIGCAIANHWISNSYFSVIFAPVSLILYGLIAYKLDLKKDAERSKDRD